MQENHVLSLLCGEASPEAEAPDETSPYTAQPPGDRGDREGEGADAELVLPELEARSEGRKQARHKDELGVACTACQAEFVTPNGHPHSVRVAGRSATTPVACGGCRS